MKQQTTQMKQLVKEECESIIKIGGEITDIKVNKDLSVDIHFKDHNCDAIGGFLKVRTVKLPKGEIKMKKTIEDKLKTMSYEDFTNAILKRGVTRMGVELSLDSLKESLEMCTEEYGKELSIIATFIETKNIYTKILLMLREFDNVMAKKYLKDEISGAEFDHIRAWITIQAYFFYEHMIEKIEMNEFFTDASMKASDKFMATQS